MFEIIKYFYKWNNSFYKEFYCIVIWYTQMTIHNYN